MFGTSRRDLQRRRRHRALPEPDRGWLASTGLLVADGVLPAGHRRAMSTRAAARRSPPTGRATSPRSPPRSAATTTRPSARPSRRAAARPSSSAPASCARRPTTPGRAAPPSSSRRPSSRRCTPRRRRLLDELGATAERPTPATSWSCASATRNCARAHLRRTRCRATGSRGWRCPARRRTASCCGSCGPRTCPATSRSPPACSPSSARARTRPGCSPARATRSAPTAASTSSPRQPATRLSTAFDSVTLYGRDPDARPDIYGKVGTSGVSIATLDDMKALYDGFDLCDPTTSVSMTINGPAPTILAYVPQHRHRPAPRHLRGRAGPAADADGGR